MANFRKQLNAFERVLANLVDSTTLGAQNFFMGCTTVIWCTGVY